MIFLDVFSFCVWNLCCQIIDIVRENHAGFENNVDNLLFWMRELITVGSWSSDTDPLIKNCVISSVRVLS